VQNNYAHRLPETLRTWAFVPEPLRSLTPYDRLCCGAIDRSCLARKKRQKRRKAAAKTAKAAAATAAAAAAVSTRPNVEDIAIAVRRLADDCVDATRLSVVDNEVAPLMAVNDVV
jgi:hypothetical protein